MSRRTTFLVVLLVGFGPQSALAAPGDLLRTFQKPTPVAGDRFGFFVAAVGSNVLVGAHLDDTGAEDAGAAYLFDSANGNLLQTFENPTPAVADNFGVSVAALGSNVLVGARYDDTGASSAGAAYLLDSANGSLLRTFENPTPVDDDSFGVSVAALGSTAIVTEGTDGKGGRGKGEGGRGGLQIEN